MLTTIILFVSIVFLAINLSTPSDHPLKGVGTMLWTSNIIISVLILMGVI